MVLYRIIAYRDLQNVNVSSSYEYFFLTYRIYIKYSEEANRLALIERLVKRFLLLKLQDERLYSIITPVLGQFVNQQ